MTKEELISALEASDVWTKDGFGHFKLTFGSSKYRLKIQPLVVRYEKRIGMEWSRKSSGYYKAVRVQDGMLWMGRWRIPITSATLPKPPVA